MAILVNMGKRGFVLNEGLLAPGGQIVVDNETGEKLSRVYPKELKLIKPEQVVVSKPVAMEVVTPEIAPVEEQPKVEPKKRGRKPKAK